MPTNSVAMAAASISDNPEFLGYNVHATPLTSCTVQPTLVIGKVIRWLGVTAWNSIREDLDPSNVCFWYTLFPHINDTQRGRWLYLLGKKFTWSLQAACAAGVCTWKVGNGSMEKTESWAQRTWDHMQGIKNKYCSFAVSQLGERFHYSSVSFSKKSQCQILVSFHFKSGTCPSFLRPLWNPRRQGQNTEGQKLGFFLLLSLSFTTLREFPTSHWHLVPHVIAGKGAVVSACYGCLLPKPWGASAASPVVLKKSHHPAPGHSEHSSSCLCITLSCLENRDCISFFPLLCVHCPCSISCLKQELPAVVVMDLLNK